MKIYRKILGLVVIICFTLSACVSSKGIDYKTKKEQEYSTKIEDQLNHSEWSQLLKKHLEPGGLVDYKGFKADNDKLTEYITYLSKNPPKDNWTFEAQLAYFINVYNANTIKLIVDNYPVKSIKDVDATISPFLKSIITIGNEKLSLADVEKGILQKMNEPRIHFAINFASISCPKLLNEAYTAENVNDLMERAAIEFVNSDKNEISENSAKVSEIFKWYKKDFLTEASSIVEYINKYANVKLNTNAEVDYITYNWNLNDTN